MITYKQLNMFERSCLEKNEIERRAKLRDVFLNQDNYSIQAILKRDLNNWMESADISRIKLITFDDFVTAFLQKISLVHKTQPVIKFDEGVNDNDKQKFQKLITDARLTQFWQDTDLKMRLHNTILSGVFWFKELDILFLDNTFNAGTCTVIPYHGYELMPKIIYREYPNPDHSTHYKVWDRNRQYVTREEPKYDYSTGEITSDKQPIESGWNIDNELVNPFVVYRYQDQGHEFWQNGMDAIIELVRMINILCTIAGDDTVQEAIRILILNFNPLGTENEELGHQGKLKTGLRHPIFPPGYSSMEVGETNATAQVVSAELYNEQIMKLVEGLVETVSALHGIDNVIKSKIESNLSGIALRLINEPLLNQWAKDINIVRGYDAQLIRKLVLVNNQNRPSSQINEKIIEKITIDYREPGFVVDESAEYEFEKQKWQDGVGSPIEYVMKRNPEWTRDECIKYIKNNIKEYNQIFGVTSENTNAA